MKNLAELRIPEPLFRVKRTDGSIAYVNEYTIRNMMVETALGNIKPGDYLLESKDGKWFAINANGGLPHDLPISFGLSTQFMIRLQHIHNNIKR